MKNSKTLSRPRPLAVRHDLHLYVIGGSVKSSLAIVNLTRVCEEHLRGRYDLKVTDISRQANLARAVQIVAVPTLIKRLPAPLRRLVGDMSDVGQVLLGLDLERQEQ